MLLLSGSYDLVTLREGPGSMSITVDFRVALTWTWITRHRNPPTTDPHAVSMQQFPYLVFEARLANGASMENEYSLLLTSAQTRQCRPLFQGRGHCCRERGC